MKTAMVLFADAPTLLNQAGEINLFLGNMTPGTTDLELWLFYSDKKPAALPDINADVSGIVLSRVNHPHLPESFLTLLEQLHHQKSIDLMIFSGDGLGCELASRLACRINGSSCLQAGHCHIRPAGLEVSKPAYGNNLVATLNMNLLPCCLSVARQSCMPARAIEYDPSIIEEASLTQLTNDGSKKRSIIPDKIDNKLVTARVVLAVGQGIKNKADMKRLEKIAVTMNAEIGASRPVVMNAWIDMNQLIGASGQVLSPNLCIAAGVSGAGVFSVGIRNSQLIVAINTDRTAPIFQVADVGVVDDLFAVLEELEKIILADRTKNESKKNDRSHSNH